MKTTLLLKLTLPLACLGILRAGIIPLATGDPIIDYMGFIVPYLGEILNVFKGFLVPIGQSLGEDIIGPVVKIIPKPDTATGFAIYFIIFAGIFLVSLLLNTMWRPKGYGKTEDKEEAEQEAPIEETSEESKEGRTIEQEGEGTPSPPADPDNPSDGNGDL